MNARDRYKRIRAHARADVKAHAETVRQIRRVAGCWHYDARTMPWLALLRTRERHAHARLPDTVRWCVQ